MLQFKEINNSWDWNLDPSSYLYMLACYQLGYPVNMTQERSSDMDSWTWLASTVDSKLDHRAKRFIYFKTY